MAKTKKTKFPLEMKNGKMAGSLEELREWFDLEKVVEYFANGKLRTWLENHYEDEACEEISRLTGEEADFAERLTAALGIEPGQGELGGADIQELMKQKNLEERLKKYYPEEEAEKMSKSAAGSQEELESLVRSGSQEIYVLMDTFYVPKWMQGVRFIGVGETTVGLEAENTVEFQRQRVRFGKNILPLDESTKKAMLGEGWEDCVLGLLDILEMELQRI